jgi:ferrous iron transport protein A
MSSINAFESSLGALRTGQTAVIREIQSGSDISSALRLMEMGLIEGARVELLHEAPFGGDPIVVRSRGTLIALRRSEAMKVRIELADSTDGQPA